MQDAVPNPNPLMRFLKNRQTLFSARYPKNPKSIHTITVGPFVKTKVKLNNRNRDIFSTTGEAKYL